MQSDTTCLQQTKYTAHNPFQNLKKKRTNGKITIGSITSNNILLKYVYGAYSSMAEHLIVDQDVVGSNPTRRPFFYPHQIFIHPVLDNLPGSYSYFTLRAVNISFLM